MVQSPLKLSLEAPKPFIGMLILSSRDLDSCSPRTEDELLYSPEFSQYTLEAHARFYFQVLCHRK